MLISKFGTISTETISEFEDVCGVKLPTQYRSFLEKYKGGETPNTNFNISGISSDLKGLYGIGKVKFSLNAVCVEDVQGTLYLPIGMDSFGNDILIGLNDGTIVFKEHENGRCKKIATSLEDFFAGCESKPINKSAIKSVEEREKDLIAQGSGAIISDALRDMWRVEINKYGSLSQEEVVL